MQGDAANQGALVLAANPRGIVKLNKAAGAPGTKVTVTLSNFPANSAVRMAIGETRLDDGTCTTAAE